MAHLAYAYAGALDLENSRSRSGLYRGVPLGCRGNNDSVYDFTAKAPQEDSLAINTFRKDQSGE